MTRLQSELQRLYLPRAPAGQETASEDVSLVDAGGQVRALVLALAAPADWAVLAQVWHGVQVELELPAPAIAVAGTDGFQLWFSLAEPVPVAQARAFLEALRQHYLGGILASRVGLLPAVAASSPLRVVHARPVPAPLPDSSHWSAFVSPDLAPVFGDEPWLDSAPNPVGQSDLLSRLKSIPSADFQRAQAQLQPAPTPIDVKPGAETAASASAAASATTGSGARTGAPEGAKPDPQRFLLDVMNDDAVPLGLRIDAAKALLPYFNGPGRA